MTSIISCSLSPNTEVDDVLLAARLLLAPWLWRQGGALGKVEAWFRKYSGWPSVSFNSGRSALLSILRAFGIRRGDEVIVQAFTCVAVPNSVRWAGAVPVFADIDASYNIDPIDIERKITKRTKAIIVQHTFGIPAAIEKIMIIAKRRHVMVIEDCAHALGVSYKGKHLGTFGDASFFSFGRDKVISSVFGGMACIRRDYPEAISRLKAYHKKLEYPRYGWIWQQLFHPVAFAIILPLYQLKVGKGILVLLQQLHLLSFPVYAEEKKGRQPKDFPARYANSLAMLLLKQLKKLDRFTRMRREAVAVYGGKGPMLRYPILVENPAVFITNAKKQGILLGNWYHNVVDPEPFGYEHGSCPHAEEAARHVVNLPTRIDVKTAKRVCTLL